MLPDYLVVAFSTTPLVVLLLINLHNVTKRRSTDSRSERSSIRPEGSHVYLASLGTFVFAIDSILFLIVTLTGSMSFLNTYPFRITFPYDSVVQVAGLVLLLMGYFLFAWSVVARGKYAVSWDMPKNHKLVTWGPYRFVRHPSYLGYMLMFIGFLLAWLNLLAAPCLIGVPGYYFIADNEEKLLIERFGDEYRRYQQGTGRLFPRLKKRQF